MDASRGMYKEAMKARCDKLGTDIIERMIHIMISLKDMNNETLENTRDMMCGIIDTLDMYDISSKECAEVSKKERDIMMDIMMYHYFIHNRV